jgi:hypothetical protein
MTKLDAKFYGEIRKAKDDSVVPEDQYMVFLAKDNAFALVLPIYLEICRTMNCDHEHIDAVARTLSRLEKWREQNQHLLKKPDAKNEKLLG